LTWPKPIPQLLSKGHTMSMLTLNGIIQNCFSKPAATDKQTGETRPASDHVQILAENVLETGEKRMDLYTLKVHDLAAFKSLEGRKVSVPVGAFVSGGKDIQFYSLRTEPRPIPAA
jgi:hypothetical protein